ncbi:hypothetical protein AT00_17285 [Pseudoalteromonas lipolytica SCSIO 04301]|uniref:DsbA family protein n=1 Tax=Pseudoalteromonas lipolytica TaxID=570156 RepID=UPI00044828E5|nr:thioredoxin domain-containing protein [Pseudoalteromonas lipolytica]EWH04900.1 hypothetical protein AT00_17285 [Pseudoalteromonas lipolytica SCSIO 04301]
MKKVVSLLITAAILTGCQTTNNTEVSSLKSEIEKLKKNQRQIAIQVGLGELVRPEKISLSADGIWIGSQDAPLVMIEYTDLNCPFCKKFQQETWPSFKEKFVDTNQVAVLARELPLASLHPKAPFAAVMLRCANQQGKYEPVKETLFELGNSLQQSDITEIVTNNSMDQEAFDRCVKDQNVHSIVTKSINEAAQLGLSSTPSFIIGQRKNDVIENYQIVSGAASIEQFEIAVKQVVEQ